MNLVGERLTASFIVGFVIAGFVASQTNREGMVVAGERALVEDTVACPSKPS